MKAEGKNPVRELLGSGATIEKSTLAKIKREVLKAIKEDCAEKK